MSVIAAMVYPEKIVMAADSIMVKDWSKSTSGDFSKINEDNGMIIGGCGSAQELSLMWHYMATHKPSASTCKGVLDFVVEFSRWKRELTGNGNIENTYLLAYAGHLFEIEDMFVFEVQKYRAIGAGMDFSNAALYLGHTPEEAVRVACDLSCMVADPIVTHTMAKQSL